MFREQLGTDDGSAHHTSGHGTQVRVGRADPLAAGDREVEPGRSLLPLAAEVVACHVLVDRSGEERSTITSPASGRVYPLRSLWRLDLPTYEAGDACPLCVRRVPLETPGAGGAAGA